MPLDPVPTGESPTTASQLRAAIDAGQTRDKINYPDPAAAPLGTDDEAAGDSPGPARLARERIPAPPAGEISDNGLYLLLVVPVALAILVVAAISA
jgi:hypothetical protein